MRVFPAGHKLRQSSTFVQGGDALVIKFLSGVLKMCLASTDSRKHRQRKSAKQAQGIQACDRRKMFKELV